MSKDWGYTHLDNNTDSNNPFSDMAQATPRLGPRSDSAYGDSRSVQSMRYGIDSGLIPHAVNSISSSSRGPSSRDERLTPTSRTPNFYSPPSSYTHRSTETGKLSSSYQQHLTTTPPAAWANSADLEDDDSFHAPDIPGRDKSFDITSLRGWLNCGTVFILILALLTLFAGYPIISHFQQDRTSSGINTSGYNLGGVNATGQFPLLPHVPSMIDKDTPSTAYTRRGFDGNEWVLVFSDEFEMEGRSFYPGDDPYWEGVDLHYWTTNDFEWYDPGAITTRDGKLLITLSQTPIHGLNFKSGMLQGWNKICFSGATYYEVSVSLPGNNVIGGFWPGVWTEGNLGRPGYGATTDGMWPYSYDSCDVGTLANQTWVNQTGPAAALASNTASGNALSYLPGQRLSACTCPGEDHPGPVLSDGTFRGRSAPEIDIIEAQVDIGRRRGVVSQSLQVAPYDDDYQFANTTSAMTIYDIEMTELNSYKGGVYQQAVSALTFVPDSAYHSSTSSAFNTYGMEVYSLPADRDNAYVAWMSSGVQSWTATAKTVAPNPRTQVAQRLIPEEPMAMVFNFGMSDNFQSVDFNRLTFPNYMMVDYLRVYQRPGLGLVGCDTAEHPTSDYIKKHTHAYNDRNITTYEDYLKLYPEFSQPKNRLTDTC